MTGIHDNPLQLSAIEKIESLNKRAWELHRSPSPEAQSAAEKALAAAEKEHYQVGIASAALILGIRNNLQGNFSQAAQYLTRALAIAQAIQNKNIEARALYTLSITLYNQSKYTEALDHQMRSLALHEEASNKTGVADVLNSIGSVYRRIGDYSRALEYFMRSLNLYEETGVKQNTAAVLNNIGNVYSSIGDDSKSLEYHMRSLACKDINDKESIATSLLNIGGAYDKMEEYERSLEHLVRSLHLHEEVHNRNGIALSLMGIGKVYGKIKEYEKSLDYLLRSLAINKEIGAKSMEAGCLSNIGAIYAEEKFSDYEPYKAIEYMMEALAILEEIQHKDFLIITHKRLSEAYEKIKDWENSHAHLKKYHTIKEELHLEEASRKIQNLETQQKFAEIEKEREITEKLLHRILPHAIAKRMRNGEENIADKYSSVSVLFADIVGFTPLAEKLGADEVLKLLSAIFSHFDMLCEKYGCEKIKTVGDEYMAASGVPVECDDHTERIAHLALAMQQDIKLNLDFKIPELSIRIGIHTGEVIAGVLGTQKLSYDIWGDTVNIASRMESTGEPDRIQVSEEVFKKIKNRFLFKERGEIEIKGKGMMKTFLLLKEQ